MEQKKELNRKALNKKKSPKKKGFWYYLYAIVILFLTIANISLTILLLTHIQNIEVKGTKYSKQGEIVEWFQSDPFTKNSLYSLWKIKSGAYELPIYLDDIDIKFSAPWNICLEVEEKEVMAGINADNTYVYFDREGLIMTIEQEPLEDVFLIEGISSAEEMLQTENQNVDESQDIEENSTGSDIKQFEKLNIEDEKIFEIIYNFVASLKKQQLSPDKIVWNDGSMNLMFGDIRVQLGKNNFDEKLAQIPPILEGEGLQGKSGVLHLENYSKVGDSITFKPDTKNDDVNNSTEDNNIEDNNIEDSNIEDNSIGDNNTAGANEAE